MDKTVEEWIGILRIKSYKTQICLPFKSVNICYTTGIGSHHYRSLYGGMELLSMNKIASLPCLGLP